MPTNSSFLASANPVEPLIFAYSVQRPDKDPASHIARHQRVGHFKLDFSKDFVRVGAVSTNTNTNTGLSTSTSTQAAATATLATPHSTVYQGSNMAYKRVEKLIILHGFLVSLGFLVLLPAGSLIGRWGRAFTPKWFRAHWLANMAVAGPVITLGVLLGPAIVYNKESFRIHFANAHEVRPILTPHPACTLTDGLTLRTHRSTAASSCLSTSRRCSSGGISTPAASHSPRRAQSRATIRP